MAERILSKSRWKRVLRIALEALLVLVILGLIAAILLPVYVGGSPEPSRRRPPDQTARPK